MNCLVVPRPAVHRRTSINEADQICTLPFAGGAHRELAGHLAGTARRWVLSYDAEPLILDLYRSRSDVFLYRVTHYYTMIGTRQKPAPGREIIFSNLPVDPAAGSERGHLSFRDASEAGPKRPVVRAVTNDNCTAPSASTPRRSARSTWVSPATAS